MVEAGAWVKVVIKDEDEEEEIPHIVASEEEDGEDCRMVASSQTSPTAALSPTSHLAMSQSCPTSPPERAEDHDGIVTSKDIEKHPDTTPLESPALPPSQPPALTTEEEEEEEEEEDNEAYLERAVARIREFQTRLKKVRTFSVETFRDSAGDVQYYTGLPDYNAFVILYDFLRPKGSSQMQYWGSVFKGRQRLGGNELGRHRKLSHMDELFLTLIRLRRCLPRKDLAARFSVSESVVTRVFITWCKVMYERFQQLPIVWSSELEGEEEGRLNQEPGGQGQRQHVLKTVPAAVKEAYLRASAYLTQSDLPVGSETRPFDRPFNNDFIEFFEWTAQRDDTTDDNLNVRERSNRDMGQNLPGPETSHPQSSHWTG
ncbi:uncharacterized protein ACJ7VT_012307 [Polymixia lowei]